MWWPAVVLLGWLEQTKLSRVVVTVDAMQVTAEARLDEQAGEHRRDASATGESCDIADGVDELLGRAPELVSP